MTFTQLWSQNIANGNKVVNTLFLQVWLRMLRGQDYCWLPGWARCHQRDTCMWEARETGKKGIGESHFRRYFLKH